jgi:hypothetical protein
MRRCRNAAAGSTVEVTVQNCAFTDSQPISDMSNALQISTYQPQTTTIAALSITAESLLFSNLRGQRQSAVSIWCARPRS